MNKKVSISDLLDAVAERSEKSKKEVNDFFSALQLVIEEGLEKDKISKISGLGTFKLVWVLPRKSVNVSSGKEVIIPGHYKISFLPEASVKKLINEPFEHLEVTDLDGKPIVKTSSPMNKNGEEESDDDDPIKKLAMQATEIKGLLDDIQGKADTIKDDDIAKGNLQKAEHEKADESLLEEKNAEVGVVAKSSVEEAMSVSEPIVTEDIKDTEKTVVESDKTNETFSYTIDKIDDPVVDKYKKNRKWLWFLLSGCVVVALVLCSVFYGAFIKNYIVGHLPKLSEKNAVATDSIQQNKVNSPSVIKYASDSLVTDGVDSTADISIPKVPGNFDSFKHSRIYNDFITTVKMTNGDRLTLLSLKYYGSKIFWPYIYEANKDKIVNPDIIESGITIKIPKLPKYAIDVNNVNCINYANELGNKYASK